MEKSQRVLVVGTTSDYIDILHKKYAEKTLLFLTDLKIREKAAEDRPEPDEELLCDLSNFYSLSSPLINKTDNEIFLDSSLKIIVNLIHKHIIIYNISLKGIACFDCESMYLTAYIAAAFNLEYPSIEAVISCRDKSITRKLWHNSGVPTPKYAKVNSASQAVDFFHSIQTAELSEIQDKNLLSKKNINREYKVKPCVLKPLDSSGSERVFCCTTPKECKTAYSIICKPQKTPDIIVESFIKGTEYSCDFIIDDSNIIPIRFTRKISAPISIFGTTMAYEIIEESPYNEIIYILSKGAESLGITKAVCMVDFIIDNDKVYLLEMTPRPGGDCLPWLIQQAVNIDTLKLNIDFAYSSYKNLILNKTLSDIRTNKLIGLRIHAAKSGILNNIDTNKVQSDLRVRDIFIKYKEGHKITLPPDNYDSWNLGHIIFQPFHNIPCKEQCVELLSMLTINIINTNKRGL